MIKNIKKSRSDLSKKKALVIRVIKSQKPGIYFFEEKFIVLENIPYFFKKNNI